MKKQQDLRLFLITRFLIVLVAVGVAEMALNALYNDFIYPVLDQAYGFKELMEGANLRDTVTAVLSGLLFLLLVPLIVATARIVPPKIARKKRV